MVTPPPIERASISGSTAEPLPPRLPESNPDQTDEHRFDGILSFLIAGTIHLILLLILALIVRPETSTSALVMEMEAGDIDGETIALQSMQFVEAGMLAPGDPAPNEVTEEFGVDSLPPLEADNLRIEPPPFQIKTVSLSNADVTETPTTAAIEKTSEKDAGVRFFGTHAYGNKFVYVLDVSGSMATGGGRRMARARNELIRSIKELQPHHSFFVVLYNNRAFHLFDNFGRARLRPATRANKDVVARWISTVQPMGGTMPADALKIAGDLLPDAVFFLSDGDFVYGEEPGAGIDQFIRGFGQARPGVLQGHPMGSTRFPKQVLDEYASEIVVHTIAFESESSRGKMEMIAKSKGGQHRFIAAPQPQPMRRRVR